MPIIAGCILATISRAELSILGTVLAVISCIARSFKAVLNAKLLHTDVDNLKPLEILLLEAPTTGLLLLGPGLLLEGGRLFAAVFHPDATMSPAAAHGLHNVSPAAAPSNMTIFLFNSGCGLLMFFNQASYITIIEQTSALTCQVLMNVKMLVLILISVRIFHTDLSMLNMSGIMLAAFGVFLYARVSAMPSKKIAKKDVEDIV